VGETGSGKSTLLHLILGLLEPTQGRVKIDGHYNACTPAWHAQIGYVPQAIYLLDATIAQNIAFGVEVLLIDRAKVQWALEQAQLESLIAQLPEGMDTLVGERGMRLSGGERQRIAIARALYQDPEVLVFDEATAALDQETERKLMATIENVRGDRTVIMVAHRLETLGSCNHLVRVEAGRVQTKAREDY